MPSRGNKKVLLCDHKRCTARGIVSPPISGGGGGVPPSSPRTGLGTGLVTGLGLVQEMCIYDTLMSTTMQYAQSVLSNVVMKMYHGT